MDPKLVKAYTEMHIDVPASLIGPKSKRKVSRKNTMRKLLSQLGNLSPLDSASPKAVNIAGDGKKFEPFRIGESKNTKDRDEIVNKEDDTVGESTEESTTSTETNSARSSKNRDTKVTKARRSEMETTKVTKATILKSRDTNVTEATILRTKDTKVTEATILKSEGNKVSEATRLKTTDGNVTEAMKPNIKNAKVTGEVRPAQMPSIPLSGAAGHSPTAPKDGGAEQENDKQSVPQLSPARSTRRQKLRRRIRSLFCLSEKAPIPTEERRKPLFNRILDKIRRN